MSRHPLVERVRARIRREGTITFRDWMSDALYDEREGYYRRAGVERWGRSGDYRTAPERGPLFASTFARYFAALYEELERPARLHLIEVGGGAGHFAHRLLMTLERGFPAVFNSIIYYFDEASDDARQRAASMLAPYGERVEFRRIGELSSGLDAAIIFSNELLDAFPVHRVVMLGGRLREMMVGLDDQERFVLIEAEPSTPRLAAHFESLKMSLAEGHEAEVNLELEEWLAHASRIVGRGFVVSVDYGDTAENLYLSPDRRKGTLRAFRRHGFMPDALADPGTQDITATVNWTHAVAAGERVDLEAVALERLDSFLLRAGLLEQLERECARIEDAAEVMRLRLDAREMILPGGLASHFQVLIQRRRGAE